MYLLDQINFPNFLFFFSSLTGLTLGSCFHYIFSQVMQLLADFIIESTHQSEPIKERDITLEILNFL